MTQENNSDRYQCPDCRARRGISITDGRKARLLLDLHERLDDPDDNVTAEELQTALMMAAEALEQEQ